MQKLYLLWPCILCKLRARRKWRRDPDPYVRRTGDREDMETREMVKEISTRGLPVGMIGDLDGWASSEFSEATLDLLESLEVPVPELKEPARAVELGEEPVPVKKKPGPVKKERRRVPDDVIARLMAAKRRQG